MTISIVCNRCQARLNVKDRAAGKRVKCPKCEHLILVRASEDEIELVEAELVLESPQAASQPETQQPPVQPYNPFTAGASNSSSDFSVDPSNPYLSRTVDPNAVPATPQQIGIANYEVVKIEAILSDAKQVGVAILICLLCSLIGSLLIGPWYYKRFKEWERYSRRYPVLLDPNAPYGSLSQRFRDARSKLQTGYIFGFIILLIGVTMILPFVVTNVLGGK